MKFQSRISCYPIYMIFDIQPAPVLSTYTNITAHPQLTPNKAPNRTNQQVWLQVQFKAPFTNEQFTRPKVAPISYERDSSVFDIELKNSRVVDGQFMFDCIVKYGDNWLQFDNTNGITLSQLPISFVIITSCGDSVSSGGSFIITDGNGSYAFITNDTAQYPVFGLTRTYKKSIELHIFVDWI